MTKLQDVAINEGLSRWDVRYYLVAVTGLESEHIVLEVAYEVGSQTHTLLCGIVEKSIEYFTSFPGAC